MYNETTIQPENLSATEWTLMQHLATFSNPFYVDDVLISFPDQVKIAKENSTLKFLQHFSRLKNAGYLAIIPLASSSVSKETHPSYKLTALGKKAVQQYDNAVFISKK